MKMYTVGVEWKMYGYLKVKADSEEEALKKAHAHEGPLEDVEDAEYLSDSWVADPEMVEVMPEDQ